MRSTFLDLKNSRIPKNCGVCPTDPRLLLWANEAIFRLLMRGLFWGAYGRYRICSTDSCITLPPQLATIEKAQRCGQQLDVVDNWYQFLDSGPGPQTDPSACPTTTNTSNFTCCGGSYTSCWGSVNYRGHYPTSSDIHNSSGVNKKLNFVCDLSVDVGKTVLALGYDQNNNWIRTLQNGVYMDGEVIAFAQGAGTNSVNFFSSVTDLQLPANMSGQSWLYELNTSNGTLRQIGHYQYNETHPSYARYFLPGISQAATAASCGQVMVEIMAKHEYIPVVNDTDYLILGNLEALQELMVALKDAENTADSVQKLAIRNAGMASAQALLDDELDHHLGSGRRIGINMLGSSVGELDPVCNIW